MVLIQKGFYMSDINTIFFFQPKPNLAKLRRMVKAWKLFGKEKDPILTE